jgi:hypothetical protein
MKLTELDSTLLEELVTLRKRAWEHDYFTASLPFAQKGAAVDIPLGTISTPAAKIQGLSSTGSSGDVVGVSGTFDIDPIIIYSLSNL